MSNKKIGQIVGDVSFRAGDGVEVPIPRGPCEIETTAQDATISWVDEDSSQVVAIPYDLYTLYLSEGRIVVS